MSLLADFVPFQSGFVLLGNTEEDLHTQYKALPPDPGVWQRLTSEGSFCCGGDAAIPIYAAGVLNGLLFLRSVSPGSMPVLSAVASLASVAVESVHETERLRDDCTVLEQRIFGNGGIPGHSPAISPAAGTDRKTGPARHHRFDSGGERYRQGTRGAPASPGQPARHRRSLASTALPSRTPCWKVNSSVTKKVPSRGRWP